MRGLRAWFLRVMGVADGGRRDAFGGDEVGDAMGDDAGLAAACSGEDQEGAVGAGNGLALLRVESF